MFSVFFMWPCAVLSWPCLRFALPGLIVRVVLLSFSVVLLSFFFCALRPPDVAKLDGNALLHLQILVQHNLEFAQIERSRSGETLLDGWEMPWPEPPPLQDLLHIGDPLV